MTKLRIETQKQEMLPIASQVQQIVSSTGIKNGICLISCPHTTAGITINENADPDVLIDFLFALDKTFPDRPEFRHFEGNSAAHLKASFVGSSATVPIQDGKIVLGKWQAIYFCEFDGPRRREFHVQVIGT